MRKLTTTIAMGACIALAFPLGSAFADSASEAKTEKVAKKSRMPMFKPTNAGSPKTRLGGATRGAHDNIPRTEALVPEEAGQTLVAQPVLYWYLSDKTTHRIDFTLIGLDPINPILETTLSGDFEPGIQRISLSDHGAKLEAGVSYQWFVAVVPDPEQRLYDRIVGGGIERLETPSDLQAKLDAAAKSEAHYVLAEAGVWYDALDALEAQIASSPGNATLLAQRAALLDQVGLGTLN
jgi:hypothetical protein